MERIGVVGLGAMGLGIAQLYAQAGFDVIATDAQPATRASAPARIRTGLEPRIAAGKLAPEAAEALLARISIGKRPEPYRILAAVVAILTGFGYVNLQTRRFFHDAIIYHTRGFKDVEIYAYSAVWLGLGIAMLIYGIIMNSREARFGSAALVVAATIKVFIFDVAGLDGALRAVSFMGLGAVLIGIGFVYQKLLFTRPEPDKPKD